MHEEASGLIIKRTLAVLRAVSASRGKWFSLAFVCQATGLPKSTAHRYLGIFCEEGIIEKNDWAQGKYRIAQPKATIEKVTEKI